MRGGLRRSAFAGACVATLLVATAAFLAAGFSWSVVGACLAALVSGAVMSWRSSPSLSPPARADLHGRHSIAEALLASIPDPVILVDRRVVVIESNPAARALLPALKLRHPLLFAFRAPDVLDAIDEVLRTGKPRLAAFETRVPTERAFEVQIVPLPMPDVPGAGQPNIVLYLRDQTSARRLETMRADFVANASHELRTPLATLSGFIETLQGSARDDAKARERFLAIMSSQAQRMTRLIDDLLSLSRIELREHVQPTQVADLGELAEQIILAERSLAQERGVSLTLHQPEPPYPVLGDRDELMRVVENLVENGVKYGGAGGVVEVALRRDPATAGRPGQVVLTVRDEGPGIAAEHIPRLTERFYRVDAASSRRKGGTGLGLAIVKHTLNRHRGRLTIESTLGRGTVVTVMLPEHAGPFRAETAVAVSAG